MHMMDENQEQQSKAYVKDLKIHNKEKSNKCSQCDYSSSHTGHLRAHMKIHNGEKSKKCNQCDYASSSASDLRKHLKTHSGEKPNKCNQCDYSTIYATALKTHLKAHGGEKSHKCNQCDYASYWAGCLRKHLKTHSSMAHHLPSRASTHRVGRVIPEKNRPHGRSRSNPTIVQYSDFGKHVAQVNTVSHPVGA